MKNTHEHICFKENWKIDRINAHILGECCAYVDSLIDTPIRPDYRARLLRVALARGAQATTAIEGNTLSEGEILTIQEGGILPPSKEYLQKEVANILSAFNAILSKLTIERTPERITVELIKGFHYMVGQGIGDAFAAAPGQFRRNNVIVGNVYRPPSFERVESLMEQFCRWLFREFHYQSGRNFDEIVIRAIVAHVYIAWIHPFSDGNGRTARLVEFYLLLRAGVPDIASHILSNHYNQTRTEYYRQLKAATETGDLSPFIGYALRGFRDGLAEVVKMIHDDQEDMTWQNYVHHKINSLAETKNQKVVSRLRQLACALPADEFLDVRRVRQLSGKIFEAYRKLEDITLRRDLDLLAEQDLLCREGGRYRALRESMKQFMPRTSGRKPGA